MELLSTQGFHGVTLSAGLEWLSSHSESSTSNSELKQRAFSRQTLAVNANPVAITFDDGFQDFYTEAFSVMQRYSFSATMFLPTAFISDTPRLFSPKDGPTNISSGLQCLTWGEIKKLHHAGVEFGAHTVNHARLIELRASQIESELRNSKHDIEEHLQAPVRTFAYPYAFPEAEKSFVQDLSGLLSKTGYKCCVTTRVGRAKPGDDPMQLGRLPMNSCDDDALFLAKLQGGYDWLAGSQRILKKAKGLFKKRTASANAQI